MIPRAYIVEWRAHAPWKSDAQVEQDLIISRILMELFLNSVTQRALLFRGGTALHKIFLAPPVRYSEDLDFVQKEPGPIGPLLSAIHSICDSQLGKSKIKDHSFLIDTQPLLKPDFVYSAKEAYSLLDERLFCLLD